MSREETNGPVARSFYYLLDASRADENELASPKARMNLKMSGVISTWFVRLCHFPSLPFPLVRLPFWQRRRDLSSPRAACRRGGLTGG
jgi:hypothetical protein